MAEADMASPGPPYPRPVLGSALGSASDTPVATAGRYRGPLPAGGPVGAAEAGEGNSPRSTVPYGGDEASKGARCTYVTTVRGAASPSVRAAFDDDVQLSAIDDTMVLRRTGTDRAALHGLVHRTSGSNSS